MKLEQQVTSLVISKRLKELEVPQSGVFYWEKNHRGLFDVVTAQDLAEDIKRNRGLLPTDLYCSAFTVAELGEMLPQILKIKKIKYQLFCSVAMDKQWFVVYANEEDYEDNAPFPFMMCHNESDARGKMLIYLLENKLIENA